MHPEQLGDNETTFTLHADATGCAGDTYIGIVLASRGGESQSVPVVMPVE